MTRRRRERQSFHVAYLSSWRWEWSLTPSRLVLVSGRCSKRKMIKSVLREGSWEQMAEFLGDFRLYLANEEHEGVLRDVDRVSGVLGWAKSKHAYGRMGISRGSCTLWEERGKHVRWWKNRWFLCERVRDRLLGGERGSIFLGGRERIGLGWREKELHGERGS